MLYKILFAFLLVGSSCFAGINLEKEYETYEIVVITCDTEVEGTIVNFKIADKTTKEVKFLKVSNNTIHFCGPPGNYEVDCSTVIPQYKKVMTIVPNPDFPNDVSKGTFKEETFIEKIKLENFNKSFLIKGVVPTPDVDPPKPDVDPDPVPPEPDVVVDPAPISEDALNVLMIEETDDRMIKDKITKDQLYTLQSTQPRRLVDDLAGQGHFRITDRNSPLIYEENKWKEGMDAWKKSGKRTPWLIISNGKTGYQGMITNLTDTKNLINKYNK